MPKPNLDIPVIDTKVESFPLDFLRLCASAPQASPEAVAAERNRDMSANPYNEPYHNKQPRRGETEIRADLAINFALTVLRRMRERRELDWFL